MKFHTSREMLKREWEEEQKQTTLKGTNNSKLSL